MTELISIIIVGVIFFAVLIAILIMTIRADKKEPINKPEIYGTAGEFDEEGFKDIWFCQCEVGHCHGKSNCIKYH